MHLHFRQHFIIRSCLDPAFWIAAEISDEFYEDIALLFLRDVPTVFQDKEPRVQNGTVKFSSVFGWNDLIILPPYNQCRLADKMRVLFDAAGIPVSGSGQKGVMRVGCG